MSEEERKGLSLAEWRALLLKQKPSTKLVTKIKLVAKALSTAKEG